MPEDLPSKTYQQNISYLREDVKNCFGRSVTSVKDFENLAEQIKISAQTLRRFFGKIDQDKKISNSSLNVICNYVGFQDWENFCKYREDLFVTDDPALLKMIFTFYDNVANSYKDNLIKEFFDTNFIYAEIIIKSPNYSKAFLKRYENQINILQFVLPFFPYTNKCATDWYTKLIENYLKIDNTSHIQVSMNAFLAFGAFLSKNDKKFHQYLSKCESSVERMREEYGVYYWPETRYTVAKIFEASLQNDKNKILKIIDAALERNMQLPNEGSNIIFEPNILYINLCNALIWTGDFDIAQEIYTAFKSIKLNERHPYSIASKKFKELFEVKVYNNNTFRFLDSIQNKKIIEFDNISDWTNNDYENILQHFITLTSTSKNEISKRYAIKTELNYLAEKTGFKKVYDIIPSL